MAGGQRVVAEAGRAEREDPQGTGEKTKVGASLMKLLEFMVCGNCTIARFVQTLQLKC